METCMKINGKKTDQTTITTRELILQRSQVQNISSEFIQNIIIIKQLLFATCFELNIRLREIMEPLTLK